jgi:hypothetical protein
MEQLNVLFTLNIGFLISVVAVRLKSYNCTIILPYCRSFRLEGSTDSMVEELHKFELKAAQLRQINEK